MEADAEGVGDGASPDRAPALLTATDVEDDASTPDAEAGEGRVLGLPGAARKLGRYTLLEPLGRGGMGVVYSAYDEELDRRVAIKFLHQASSDRRAWELLIGEAQAMARLAHPNVIHVYEVGIADDRVFIAMEFVRGESLRRWMSASRPWPEVVSMFLQAGRGLAAAHQAGLVHCDFKPDNVLVGEDGRARVLDFGLARRQPSAEALAPAGVDAAPGAKDAARPAGGTPGYMPREAYEGRPADPRGDQFSFCVALFEALYRQRPFPGDSPLAMASRVIAGAIEDAPAEARVPARLRRAVRRGLAADPAERHPSMTALLGALERSLPRPRGAWLAAALASALVTAGVASWRRAREDPAAACAAEAAAEVAAIWGAPRRAAVARAFAATGLSYAADSLARSDALLDAYAAEWIGARRYACEIAREHPASTGADRARARCLDRRRQAFAAWVGALTRADAGVVERSVAATAELPAAALCGDAAPLPGEVEEEAAPARAEAIAAIEERLAEARALELAGQHDRGFEPVREALEGARRIGDRRLEAEALLERGILEIDSVDAPQAAETLRAAFFLGEAARHTRVRAEAALQLVYATGGDPRVYEAGEAWARHAEAIADGLGEAALDLRAALQRFRGRVAIRRRQYAEALVEIDEALALEARRLGAEHPSLAVLHEERGDVLLFLERYDEALAAHDRALVLTEAALGAEHPRTARTILARGKVQERLGRYDDALRSYERALAIWERVHGSEHPRLIWAHTCVGRVHMKAGDLERSERAYARALAIAEAALGADALGVADALVELGGLLRKRGRRGEARALLERAQRIFEAQVGERYPLALALIELGEDALEGGESTRARALLERARRVQGEETNTPDELARTLFALAQALWADGEQARALELGERALERYREAGEAHAVAREAAAAWVAARGATAHGADTR